VTRLFFAVSGEHQTLPFAEIPAILESAGLPYSELTGFTRVLCLTSPLEGAYVVARRSSLTKLCGLELFRCNADRREVQRHLRDVPFPDYLPRGQSFSVRVTSFPPSPGMTVGLEREIGAVIARTTPGASVDLVNPDRCFLGFFTDSTFIFGVQLAAVSAKPFLERRPGNRPFHHPSTMPPKLARCLVNLARAPAGGLVLDPFCGAGSILLEAGAVGCRVVGADVNAVMVEGCSRNLTAFRVPCEGLLVGDARRLPLTAVDCIVSDPPYGRASSARGGSLLDVVSDFLVAAMAVLPRRGYLALALPSDRAWQAVATGLGYACVGHHLVREHKSLTREILLITTP
jgi:tRNA (guanine10-N2)-dimethyltransferase